MAQFFCFLLAIFLFDVPLLAMILPENPSSPPFLDDYFMEEDGWEDEEISPKIDGAHVEESSLSYFPQFERVQLTSSEPQFHAHGIRGYWTDKGGIYLEYRQFKGRQIVSHEQVLIGAENEIMRVYGLGKTDDGPHWIRVGCRVDDDVGVLTFKAPTKFFVPGRIYSSVKGAVLFNSETIDGVIARISFDGKLANLGETGVTAVIASWHPSASKLALLSRSPFDKSLDDSKLTFSVYNTVNPLHAKKEFTLNPIFQKNESVLWFEWDHTGEILMVLTDVKEKGREFTRIYLLCMKTGKIIFNPDLPADILTARFHPDKHVLLLSECKRERKIDKSEWLVDPIGYYIFDVRGICADCKD